MNPTTVILLAAMMGACTTETRTESPRLLANSDADSHVQGLDAGTNSHVQEDAAPPPDMVGHFDFSTHFDLSLKCEGDLCCLVSNMCVPPIPCIFHEASGVIFECKYDAGTR